MSLRCLPCLVFSGGRLNTHRDAVNGLSAGLSFRRGRSEGGGDPEDDLGRTGRRWAFWLTRAPAVRVLLRAAGIVGKCLGWVCLITTAPASAGDWPGLDWAGVEGAGVVAEAVPRQYVVGLRSGVSLASASSWMGEAGRGIARIRWVRARESDRRGGVPSGDSSVFSRLVLVELEPAAEAAAVVTWLVGRPGVAFVEPNYTLSLFDGPDPPRVPNDFRFGELWGLLNTGQSEGQVGADIGAPEAWSVVTEAPDIVVAVIDTGVDFFHPDLEGNLWRNSAEEAGNGVDDDGNGYLDDIHGYDFVSEDSDPMDDQMHGTHVAGTIGAVGNNRIGVTGVCWRVPLMCLKAFNDGGEASLFDVLRALDYAIRHGARVINASWGMHQASQALHESISEAARHGVLLVAAAGNDRNDQAVYPAAYPEVIAVAATDAWDQRSVFSSYGAHVDVAAPGELILSTIPGNRYEFSSGTSMAAPFVSGTAALVLHRFPTLEAGELRAVLANATDPVTGSDYIGLGRLDAARALRIQAPLPRAELALPALVSGRIDVRGTAAGARFARYVLEYGTGTYPTDWIRLHEAAAPVEDGVLWAGFSSADLAEGSYVLRLVVDDVDGQTATARSGFKVRNVELAYPFHNDILRAGETIELRGRVYGPGRVYTIQHGVGRHPAQWSADGITLVGGGGASVGDGVLGWWDTSQVGANEFYTLRLQARVGEQEVGESEASFMYLDGRMRPGWPHYFGHTGEYSTNDWRQPTVADLEGDGRQEILIVHAGTTAGVPGRLVALRFDGSEMWSRALGALDPYADVPVVGDLEGDGLAEVFVDVGAAGLIYGFHGDGSPLGGRWPVAAGVRALAKTLADLDGDGQLELIGLAGAGVEPAGGDVRELIVLKASGEIWRRWVLAACVPTLDVPRPFPVVGDFDDDPELEIVAASSCSELALFDIRSPDAPVWKVRCNGLLYGSPAVGDVDGDCRSDLVIGAVDPQGSTGLGTRGGVHLFDRTGEEHAGWPVRVECSFPSSPALGDVDGDGALEIAIADWKNKSIHLLGRDGFERSGWPVRLPQQHLIRSSPLLADVAGLGRPQIVAAVCGLQFMASLSGQSAYFGGVRAWDLDGTPVDLNPKSDLTWLVMESGGGNRGKLPVPTLTDLDGNGRMDVVAATVYDAGFLAAIGPGLRTSGMDKLRFSLYAWELDTAHVPERCPWPMLLKDPAHTARVPLTVPPNLPPLLSAIPSQIIAPGGAFFPVELDSVVTDPDDTPEELVWEITGSSALRVVIDTNRVASIVPVLADWSGSETLRFVVRDPGGLSTETTATFTVQPGYEAPRPQPDTVQVREDESVLIDVLANDWQPHGLPLWVAQVGRPRTGRVEVVGGLLRYVPQADFNGTDAFVYMVADGQGGVAQQRVAIDVLPVPDPPIAVVDRAILEEDTSKVLDVLANDYDVDGDPMQIMGFDPPDQGRLEREAEGRLLYQPPSDWSGSASFRYRIADSTGREAEASVQLMVKPVNDLPQAQAQAFVLNRNSSQEVIFRGSDPDGDALSFRVLEGPAHGQLWAYPALAIYYPKPGFVGEDGFSYEASDGQFSSPPAEVRFQVLSRNNPPVAESDFVVTKVGRPVAFELKASDLDADALELEIVDPPVSGTLTGQGTNRVYAPFPLFLGEDGLTFRAYDGEAFSALGEVRFLVTSANSAPIADDLYVEVPMNWPSAIRLSAQDWENDPLSYVVLTNPVMGRIEGTAPDLWYTPEREYSGPDRLMFQASDGELWSKPATVSILVTPANQTPCVTSSSVVVRGWPTSFRLPVSDADGDPLRCAILKGPAHGRVYGLGETYTYAPGTGYSGLDSLTFKAWDGYALSDVGQVVFEVRLPDPDEPPQFEAIKRLPDGSVQFRLRSPRGRTALVEASADLANWETLGTYFMTDETVTQVDAKAIGCDSRYYRARTLPGG